MNGIIPKSEKRISRSHPKVITMVILGGCLLNGITLGMTLPPSLITKLNPFKIETLHFDKISWFSDEKLPDFKLASSPLPSDSKNSKSLVVLSDKQKTQDLAFVPFELKKGKAKIRHFGFSKPKRNNFIKLEKIVQSLQEVTRYDAFNDYRNVLSKIRNEFVVAMKEVPGARAPSPEVIAMTSSSEEIFALALAAKANTQKYKIHLPVKKRNKATVASEYSQKVVNTKAPEPNQEEVVVTEAVTTQITPEPIVTTSNQISNEEKNKLAQALLNFQLSEAKKIAANTPAARQANQLATIQQKRDEKRVSMNSKYGQGGQDSEPALHLNSNQSHDLDQAVGAPTCESLSNHIFIRPNQDTHFCPPKMNWISNSRSNSGWLKVEGDDQIPTLTLYPAPNLGSTLLLDQNALALISLKSGVHVTRGMGVVIGLVPDGYKINFGGRSEETEYFENSGKRYFAIMNAEPGAGVVQVESKKDPNINSTIFTPVLEDTVTYLDLSTPSARTLNIRVEKNLTENDSEIANLTVGLSTQSGIRAITQPNGRASLKSVFLIPGFPVFVDISSVAGIEQSFTYRFELKHLDQSGTYVLQEINEKSIYHWLKQVKLGLSDQSAMVVGSYDKKKLNGFKNLHFTQVEPLTAKFGLEPLNYTVLWDGKISATEPLEGDVPRLMSVQVPEGLSQVKLLNEDKKIVKSDLIPISPRVIHIITE